LRRFAVQWTFITFPESAMTSRRRWIPALLALSALTACAATPPQDSRPAGPASAATVSKQRVYVTGSRIPQPVGNPHASSTAGATPLQVVDQDQLQSTGQSNMGSVLHDLVPALHSP
jgi:ABC-type phosphate transport system substrate-binding protein